jgi:hypothetical protein
MDRQARTGDTVLVKSREMTEAELKENMVLGPYAGVEYYLTLFPLQSWLQHIYHI